MLIETFILFHVRCVDSFSAVKILLTLVASEMYLNNDKL